MMKKPLIKHLGFAGAAALLSVAIPSFAQNAMQWKLQCVEVGIDHVPEPLGDREGHSISVTNHVCRTEGGPLDGAIFTGQDIYEWNGLTGEVRAGGGIYRKPGAMAMHDRGEGKTTLTMADGKVTGWSYTGHGTYNAATGTAAMLSGKTWNAVARPTAPGQFIVEVKVE